MRTEAGEEETETLDDLAISKSPFLFSFRIKLFSPERNRSAL
jgi:hypothetical protein